MFKFSKSLCFNLSDTLSCDRKFFSNFFQSELETEAEKLLNEISDIKEKYNLNKAKSDDMLGLDVEKMSMEDAEKSLTLKGHFL